KSPELQRGGLLARAKVPCKALGLQHLPRTAKARRRRRFAKIFLGGCARGVGRRARGLAIAKSLGRMPQRTRGGMWVDTWSERVIGAAIAVHRTLGPGLLESAYQACFCEELAEQ